MRSTVPSKCCGMFLCLPLAGESSEKSMYSFAQIRSSNFMGNAGSPLPSDSRLDVGLLATSRGVPMACDRV